MHAAMQHQSEAGAAGIYAVPWQQTKESTVVGALRHRSVKTGSSKATHNNMSHRLPANEVEGLGF